LRYTAGNPEGNSIMDKEIVLDVLKKARKHGVDHLDILLDESSSISVTTRLSKPEKIVQANTISIGMRVSIGERSAIIATDSCEEFREQLFLEKAIAAARNAAEDRFCIRPRIDELCKNFKKIDLCDDLEPSLERLIEDSSKCESVALAVKGITNSQGAEASHVHSRLTLFKDDCFAGAYEKTIQEISIVTLASKGENLERDYDFSRAIYYSDLRTPENIGRNAAEKTLRRLGAKKIPSCKVPVIFDRAVSRQLLSSLLSALNGAAIAKAVSFLKDKLAQKIFNSCINITDVYAIDRGLRSRPFDADGLECKDNIIVKNGALSSFLLNAKYAHQLGMNSTANASGFEEIAPHNIRIENGKETFDELKKSIKAGLYVTDVLGNGLNIVTGNYSQGAAGFWVENGEVVYPVHEITIAGNFVDMLANCRLASDMQMETGIDAPAILVEEMIVGGV
jgi:PmbA protein